MKKEDFETNDLFKEIGKYISGSTQALYIANAEQRPTHSYQGENGVENVNGLRDTILIPEETLKKIWFLKNGASQTIITNENQVSGRTIFFYWPIPNQRICDIANGEFPSNGSCYNPLQAPGVGGSAQLYRVHNDPQNSTYDGRIGCIPL